MKVGIMQPYFFPYLGYWQLINAVDRYVVYDDVTYIKGGWINRNNILLGGAKHLITLPLDQSSSFKNINEIGITSNEIAINKVIKTLQSAYSKAPYYPQIMPMVEGLIRNNSSIATLNYDSILTIDRYLGIETEILLSSELKKDSTLKGQEKVIHINKLLGSDSYYNAIGGQALYQREAFEKCGMELHFVQMGSVQYHQFKNEFVPGLSIIDVLMFNSVEKIQEFLQEYTLV